MKNNQTGRSMVEMLGVLAIIGVLSAGGLAGYSKAMFKHKMNTTMDQLTMLVTNIRTLYGTQDNYNGLKNSQAVALGIVPASMQKGSASSLTNPFKGSVVIAPAAVKSGLTASGFTIQYNDLPREACISLATADWGSGAGSGFIGAMAGSIYTAKTVADTSGNATNKGEGNPLSLSDATNASACASDQSSVTLYFY